MLKSIEVFMCVIYIFIRSVPNCHYVYFGIKQLQVCMVLKRNKFVYLYLNVLLILGGRGDWSNKGCSNATMNDELRSQDIVICKCNHLSTFGIFVVRQQLHNKYCCFY